jgi:hypothetical protein
VDPWLALYEIILHFFQDPTETPVDVCFRISHLQVRDLVQVLLTHFVSHPMELLPQEDKDKWGSQIVDSLNIAAGGVFEAPDEEDPI